MDDAKPQPTILAVDDDTGMLLLITERLEEEGYDVVTARSGGAAAAWLESHSPDLMLLDLKLKDVEGQKLVDRLRKRHTAVPFIVITGQGDERVAVTMMKQGALDYLVKDRAMLELLPAVVKQAFERLERDRQLAAAHNALRESQSQLLTVSEREQRRIGQDLHDGLGQQLTAMEFLCHSLLQDLEAPDLEARRAELRHQADGLGQRLREATAFTRALSHGLAPVTLDREGLMAALADLAVRTDALGPIRCQFECPVPVFVSDSLVAGHLFRIAQEAVNNALKHAQARALTVRLAQRKNGVALEIADDGRGLPKHRATAPGMGLEVMRHRANVMGAALRIESLPNQGVTVTCLLPTHENE
jgi:signal transduction histidine kinase